jgi:predicted pyridoxine 5'-phosphate oxidase superfamily flavin-nucleotide-binding protein
MPKPSSDIAFTPAVKAIHSRRSRAAYAEQEARGGFLTTIDESLVLFLAGVDTAYMASANAVGQPHAQHRGGPKGFIRVVDGRTLAPKARPTPTPSTGVSSSTS